MSRCCMLAAALLFAYAGGAAANKIPTEPIMPIGCATANGTPYDSLPADDSLAVDIVASRLWGVVPFEARFDAVISQGTDSILDVAWDFDADGLADASGTEAAHVFSEPVDQTVTADVATLGHGTLRASATISGHSALMTLTFDDGQQSVMEVAMPVLHSRGVAATAYIVPTWIGWGWYMSWGDLHFLEDLGWDIESHGLTHVDLTKADSVTLHYELSQSRAELQAQGFDAEHFAPAFGACNWTVIRATMLYYQSCRNWRGVNPPVEQVDPYQIKWEVTSSTKPFSAYEAMMDSVIATGGWLVLNSHIVDPACDGLSTCLRTQMLIDIVDHALANRIKLLTIEQALSSVADGPQPPEPPRPLAAPVPDECSLNLSGLPVSSFPVAASFTVPAGAGAELGIYDACGRMVARLDRVSEDRGAGLAIWNGQNSSGTPVANGCYFCVLTTGAGARLTRKIVVAR